MAQDALQGSLPLLVLTILARRGPLHGYALATQIEGSSEDVLSVEEGSLYPALHRMEEAGWLTSSWGESASRRRARYYRLTAAGRRRLAAETAEWGRVSQAVRLVLRTT